MRITGAENWKKIMKKADKSGQKPKPKKKETSIIKKTKKLLKGVGNVLGVGSSGNRVFQGVGNVLGVGSSGNRATGTNVSASANVNESHHTENAEVGLVNRIFEVCAVIDNEDITQELLQNVDNMRSMVDNNNNNSTSQQKFAEIWRKHTLLNTENIRLPKVENSGNEKRWDSKFKELAKFYRDHPEVKRDPNSNLGVWEDTQRRTLKTSTKSNTSIMTPRRYMLLNSINFDWNPTKKLWYINYNTCLEYQKQNGSLKGFSTKQKKLYKWLKQFVNVYFPRLNDDQKQRLRELFEEETGDLAKTYMRQILSAEEFKNWQLKHTNIKGRWSPTEKKAFVRGFELHGNDWVKIAAVVTTRTGKQCKDYWKNNPAFH